MWDASGKRPFHGKKGHHRSPQLGDLPYLWHPSIAYYLLACALAPPTGGGKLISTRDSFAAGQGRVSCCISPLLSLGADQVIKINAHSANGGGAGVAFHLDHYPHPSQQCDNCWCAALITGASNSTVCITSSPQALTNNKLYFGLYRTLLDKNSLKLLMIWWATVVCSLWLPIFKRIFRSEEKVFAPLSLSGGRRSRTLTSSDLLLYCVFQRSRSGLIANWSSMSDMATSNTVSFFKMLLA